jgi:hypothetical protein
MKRGPAPSLEHQHHHWNDVSNDALSASNRGIVPPMDRRDSYLFKAAELLELAKNEHYAEFKAEFESLALAYLRLAAQANLRLAKQAKQKGSLDIASDTPPFKQHDDPQPKH